MRCAVLLEKIVQHGDLHPFVVHGECKYPLYEFSSDSSRFRTGVVVLPAGTYTVTAELDGDITCKIFTYINYVAAGMIPESGEGELPYTFTIPEARTVTVEFAYRGWGTTSMPAGAVSNVAIIEGSTPVEHEDVWETVLLRPDEIADSDTIAQTINCKSTIVLQILPYFEAWQFAEKSVTYVRVLDLDKPSDRIIFRGRVSAITDSMGTDGKLSQELTCVSALDFFEDTSFFSTDMLDWTITQSYGMIPMYVGKHNDEVDDFRKFGYLVSGTARYKKGGTGYGSFYSILSTVLTDGNLRKYQDGNIVSGSYTMEFREDFSGDTNTLKVAESFGQTVDTAIMIGDNLRSIRVERAVQDALYTSVRAVTGVNSDGGREQATARNDELYAVYGSGHELLLVADDIKCTAPKYEYVNQGGAVIGVQSEAWNAMLAAIDEYAKEEAAKLSQTPIKLTISAVDLAAMGFSGYEPFEVGNSHPVICPPLGLAGKPMRITSIRRRLSDGRIEQITIETGKSVAKSTGSLSDAVAKLEAWNKNASDSAADSAAIAATKASEQTGGYTWETMTIEQYNDMEEHDDMTVYIVDNNGTTEEYIGDQLITQKGGGGGTLQTGAVMTGEQSVTWIPGHELVPVSFSGSATVYYGGSPARIVLQGQCALFGVAAADIVANDIMSEITMEYRNGTREKVKVYVAWESESQLRLGVAAYDITGASEVLIGHDASTDRINRSSGLQIGMVIYVSELYDNDEEHLAPAYTLYLAAKPANGTATLYAMPQAGQSMSGRNADFGSLAEEGFASGVMRRTEPSEPS